jgi:hypothetical protein
MERLPRDPRKVRGQMALGSPQSGRSGAILRAWLIVLVASAGLVCVSGQDLAAQEPQAAAPDSSTFIADESLQAVSRDPARDADGQPLCISGVYPHLAAFNGHGECGIGALVPWAGRLWWITYPPHMRTGSNDKLYSTDESLLLTVHPESVGGTHAARLIHEPSDQLFLGPYAIDGSGQVRSLDVQAIPGRYTAWAHHLEELESKLYLFDMEGPIWEVDVNTLEGKRLFVKPAPGWHGKGAYSGQNRLVIANNGESSAAHDLPGDWELPAAEWPGGPEAFGGLAEYDGNEWRTLQRRQHVEVTGPGGIRGTYDPSQPVWAVGWDRRSVLLSMCDGGEWSTWRLPKGSHAMDPSHGWYTEWPRLREVSEGVALLCMAGMFYEFPLDFRREAASGIRPLASHLRYVTDFCVWNNRFVTAADDTSILENPQAGQSQSNLWFGNLTDLRGWGVGAAYGGPWLGDDVPADTPSDPYLFAGFQGRVLHLAAAGGEPVGVDVEVDYGDGVWESWGELTIPASGYFWYRFEDDVPGEWIRFRLHEAATVSAYLHYRAAEEREPPQEPELFSGLPSARFKTPVSGESGAKVEGLQGRNASPSPCPLPEGEGSATSPRQSAPSSQVLVRPAGHNDTLQVLRVPGADSATTGDVPEGVEYFEMNGRMELAAVEDAERRDEAYRLLSDFPAETEHADQVAIIYDAASAIVTLPGGERLRLPRVPGTKPFGRTVREVQSERSLAHIGNTFYEVPRGELGKQVLEFRKLRPIASHSFAISDFCSWRGLLVLAGARDDAQADGHVFGSDGGPKVWCGMVDDLWKLGPPVGQGGPWLETAVTSGAPSDPYLMTGFDRKVLALRHDAPVPVRFEVEVDYSNRDFWKPLTSVTVPPGESVVYEFPEDYSAHWVRLSVDRDCTATAWFEYGIHDPSE